MQAGMNHLAVEAVDWGEGEEDTESPNSNNFAAEEVAKSLHHHQTNKNELRAHYNQLQIGPHFMSFMHGGSITGLAVRLQS